MKIAILGCSHSSGFVSVNGVNPEGGWVPKLAQLYPEHNFYVYVSIYV